MIPSIYGTTPPSGQLMMDERTVQLVGRLTGQRETAEADAARNQTLAVVGFGAAGLLLLAALSQRSKLQRCEARGSGY